MFFIIGWWILWILKTFFSYDDLLAEEIRTTRIEEIRNYINDSVNPCDDFYEFACGNWERFNPIPDDDVENNEFSKLNTKLVVQVRELLEGDNSAQYDDGSAVLKKTKDFYRSCHNISAVRRRGIEPLSDFLRSAGRWPILDDKWSGAYFNWIDMITKFKSQFGMEILLTATIYDNLRNVSQHEIYISETKISLPNKDYFYDKSKRYQLNAYKEFMLDVFKLFGVHEMRARRVSDEILQFEKEIAVGTIDSNIRPDLQELLIPTSVNSLQEKYPDLNWTSFIEKSLGITVKGSQPITVLGDEYIPNLLRVISSTNQDVIANYIMWMVTRSLLKYTDGRFDEVEQKYLDAVVGSHQRKERWKDCVSITQNAFGYAIGSMYIKNFFSKKSQKDVQQLARKIKSTFRNTLDQNDWIDDITLDRLHVKINNMQLEVGYPDYIMSEDNLNKEYGDIDINLDKYFENVLNILKHHQEKERKKLNKEVDRTARFNPVTANAFYEATRNRIIIPAGILQYPIYNRYLPKSINFGQIGAILGHELIHGFDDIGQNFDPDGNMVRWWTESATENFKNRTLCFISQYNNYIYDGYQLRGDASVGENVAEIGGLRQAFYAYKKWLEEQNSDTIEQESFPQLDFTNIQLFFISYAQLWCAAHKPEALRHRINIDNHMPSKYRVIGSLSNFKEFAEEFGCPVDSGMNPRDKCKMW